MKISTRTRYGSRALVELATVYPTRALSVKQVAQAQHMSVKYLENIMASLKAAGLIRAVRGVNGGHMLARPPTSINLSQVVEALEGSLTLIDCVEHPESCPMIDLCPTQDLWIQIGQSMAEILESTNLQDLVDRKEQKLASYVATYQI